jgi:hypothetical protein
MRKDSLKSWSDAKALLLRNDRKGTFPATIGCVGDGVVPSVELAGILGAGVNVSI